MTSVRQKSMRLGTTNQDVLICICSLTTLVILILSCSVLQCWLYICPAASIKWEAQISVDGWGSIARSIPRLHKVEPTLEIQKRYTPINKAPLKLANMIPFVTESWHYDDFSIIFQNHKSNFKKIIKIKKKLHYFYSNT